MKTCIINVESLTFGNNQIEESIINGLTKKDKLYVCYKENANLTITNFFSLSKLYEKTNVEFVKENDELLVLFGVVFSNAKDNNNLYVDKNIEVPKFILENTKITIEYLNFKNIVANKPKRKYTKRKNVENSSSKSKKSKTNVSTTKKQNTQKNNKNESKTDKIVADSVNYPVKRKRGRPSKQSKMEETNNTITTNDNEQLKMEF